MASSAAEKSQPALSVFAAVSLTNALQDIGNAFTKRSARTVQFTFASSAILAKRIEAGERADIFISADLEWINYLRAQNAIKAVSEHTLVDDELVLIAPTQSTIALKIKPQFALREALGEGRLAVADPDSVAAGRYARSALITLGVWPAVADRLLPGEDTRAVLMFVSRGAAPLGIVYRSDVLADDPVRIVGTFPADTHRPLVYAAALTAVAAPGAQTFLDYLTGPAATAVFRKYGLTLTP